jgi:hypothetical protein
MAVVIGGLTDRNLRMTDMRLGCLLQGTCADHSLVTEISRCALSPSSSGAETW